MTREIILHTHKKKKTTKFSPFEDGFSGECGFSDALRAIQKI